MTCIAVVNDDWLQTMGVRTLPKPFDLDHLYGVVREGLSSAAASPAEAHSNR